jgi:hypothetical protein
MKFSAIRAEPVAGLVGQAVFGGVITLQNQRQRRFSGVVNKTL